MMRNTVFQKFSLWAGLAVSVLALQSPTTAAQDAAMHEATSLYHERCTLCHGAEGFGDGLLAMYIKGYPNTALLRPRKATTREEVRNAIYFGGLNSGVNQSPPWKDELSAAQIDALTDLILYMRNDRKAALALLAETRPASVPTQTEGRVLFKTYCTRCHGDKGYGDGRMAKVYKDPPPFPLVFSAMPGAYLTHIITEGGASVGRSEVMPSFGEQLSSAQIQSVILHLYAIRLLNTERFH